MILVATVLFAFPLGLLLRQRMAAYLAYVAVYGYCFSFQGVYLTTAWVRGEPAAEFPADGGLRHRRRNGTRSAAQQQHPGP